MQLPTRLALVAAGAVLLVGVPATALSAGVAERQAGERQEARIDAAVAAIDGRRLLASVALADAAADGLAAAATAVDPADLEQALREIIDRDYVSTVSVRLADEVVSVGPLPAGVDVDGLLAGRSAGALLREDATATVAGATADDVAVSTGSWTEVVEAASELSPAGREIGVVVRDEDGDEVAAVGTDHRARDGDAVVRDVDAGGTTIVLTASGEPIRAARADAARAAAGTVGLAAALAAMAAAIVGRRYTTAMATVVSAARAAATDDTGAPPDPPDLPPEVAEVRAAVDEMAVGLRAQVEASARTLSEFRAAVGHLGDVLAASHDLPRLLDVIVDAAVGTVAAASAAYFDIVAEGDVVLRAAVVRGDIAADAALGEGLAVAAARRGRVVTWPSGSASAPPPAPPEPADIRSAIAVPLTARGVAFAVLAVYGRRPDHPAGEVFTPEDVETLQTLARQAEVAVDNVRVHEDARRQATTDELTGLTNRRRFEQRCREEVQRASRFGERFAVALVDADHFKRINDDFDHPTGDAALRWLADHIRAATREIDVAARWGGEEFALLLPSTGPEEAMLVAERLRQQVRSAPFDASGTPRPVTVSVGVAGFPEHGADLPSLVKAADDALYRAKSGGRDRVERAGAPTRSTRLGE